MTTRSTGAAALLLAALACVPDEGPLMAPNEDCLACHGRGEGPAWTVAGTFGGKGSHVTISDASGRSFTVRTAENGNFYTAEKVAFPLAVSVDGEPMADDRGTPIPVDYGGCNLCHGPGGDLLALDEFMTPGVDCLGCHDGGRARAFTAAGTWSGPGLTVTVSGAPPMTTNRVGNFFTSDPITLPGTARVGGETMDDLDYGGCNRCHPFGRDAEGD